TVNDVLVAAVTSAIRRYLVEHDSLVKQIRVAVPINLRPLDGPIELGNKFGLVYLPLPVGLSDAKARFNTLKATMDAIKRSPEAVVAHGLLGLIGLLPPAIKVPLLRLFGNKNSGVLTNVPGPRKPIYLAGSKLNSLMFWVPQSGGVGLGISIISYNGTVNIGVAGDSGLVSDPHAIVRYFEQAFDTMLEQVQNDGNVPLLPVPASE
ncbi:MAG: WS/DGAT domain-containing protein, partial [Myxococcota bacterium]